MGITFNVYGDSAGTESIFPFDLGAAHRGRGGMGRIERGLKQRIHALNLFIDDIYHDQKILKDGVVPANDHPFGEIVPQAMHRAESAARHLVPHHRHGSGARPRRTDLRAGRQPALSLGRVLRAGEPRGDEAHVSAGLRVVADSSGRRLSEPAARHAGVSLARPVVHHAARRAADAGHLQLGVLRALRFLAQQMGVELVEGPRPRRVRRLRLDAHDQGLRARGRDLPPHRRRFPRPASVSAPTRCWACRG